MRSVMAHKFSEVPSVNVPRSVFDRSHGRKTTMDAGKLVPVYVDEVMPGDTFNMKAAGFLRLSTPIFPIMDNMVCDLHFFAVPIRLIWDNFRKFMGERENPADSIDYTIPTMTSGGGGGYANESLHDYLGIPTGVASLTHSALPTRAYARIYNDWYRDQQLQDSITVDTDDGPDTHTDYALQTRGKRHDYFTSALPWPQKGDSVELPLGTSAPLVGTLGIDPDGTPEWRNATDRNLRLQTRSADSVAQWDQSSLLNNTDVYWETTGLDVDLTAGTADLSSATAATINELRQAFQVQRLLEQQARAGSRYTEIVQAAYGIRNPDLAHRSEFLGGGSAPVNINPVAQTSATDAAVTPQGNLAATGTVGFSGHGFVKSFTEHCIVMGIVSVRADLTYQQGLDRMFSRSTRYDLYWPLLSMLGEQTILNKEIYADGSANDDLVFGYQERNAEYRYKPSTITGKFRSNDANSLDAWHLSQEFGSLPTLGSTFIVENAPLDRCVAVDTEPEFIADFHFNLTCARPMPMYGVPGGIDRF